MSRAQLYGTPTGKVLENAYFLKTYSLDAYDMIRFLMINDGPSTGPATWDYPNQVTAAQTTALSGNANGLKLAENVLFAQETQLNFIGMAYAKLNGCTLSTVTTSKMACEFVFTTVVAQGYTNGSVAVC